MKYKHLHELSSGEVQISGDQRASCVDCFFAKLVMSIFNRFFDDRLNRLSKNQFFFDFLKFNFDLSIALKSKNRFLTPLLPYHVNTARAKSARCRFTFALVDFFIRNSISITFIWTFFGKSTYFWQHRALNGMSFAVSTISITTITISIFRGP